MAMKYIYQSCFCFYWNFKQSNLTLLARTINITNKDISHTTIFVMNWGEAFNIHTKKRASLRHQTCEHSVLEHAKILTK